MPTAPKPTFNSHGMLQRPWSLGVRYEPSQDVLVLYWQRPGDTYSREMVGSISYPPDDVEALLEALSTMVHTLNAPRLF